MGVWLQFGRGAAVWEGRGGMGKKKKEKHRKRVSVDWWAYNGFFRRNHRRKESVGDSVGESATSLYGYLSLNPLVMSVGKITWRHHAVAYFQTNCIPCRRNRRYIPTDFETELLYTDGKIPSVIPLVFSDFLVVTYIHRTLITFMNRNS